MNMSRQARQHIAHKCGISDDYLYQVLTGRKSMRAERCIEIEKAAGGAVRCEDLRPDVDWAYLRGTASTLAPAGSDIATAAAGQGA
jgi:DNA-binding transcriptional regulator YdaS (Cro superfamily)